MPDNEEHLPIIVRSDGYEKWELARKIVDESTECKTAEAFAQLLSTKSLEELTAYISSLNGSVISLISLQKVLEAYVQLEHGYSFISTKSVSHGD